MNNSAYKISTMFPLILWAALAIAPLHADGEQPTETRKTISLNEGWRFQKGWFTLPGRTPVSGWRYRMDPQGEASAATMAAPGLDTSGADWREGSKFDARKGPVTLVREK